jgi:hypothetical protein
MKKIYVCGPFSGLEMQNTRKAVLAAQEVREAGYSPYIPHLFAFVDYLTPVSYEDAMRHCFVWIEACDGLLFLGTSPGAEREVKFAKELGIPVFFSVEEITRYFLHN